MGAGNGFLIAIFASEKAGGIDGEALLRDRSVALLPRDWLLSELITMGVERGELADESGGVRVIWETPP